MKMNCKQFCKNKIKKRVLLIIVVLLEIINSNVP